MNMNDEAIQKMEDEWQKLEYDEKEDVLKQKAEKFFKYKFLLESLNMKKEEIEMMD